MDALAPFDPVVRTWFAESLGAPTDAQCRAWPHVAAGRNVLLSAPTGSGKTLAAFLWGLDRLLTGAWPGGGIRLLYVSPLKALNNDVQRNLLAPLGALRARFTAAGREAAPVRVLVRSGDTPQAERERMARRPPEVLVTTPESLNILLTSPRGRALFEGLRTVVLDEVHAVAGTKRGVHLVTAVERLVPLAGEFQRLALSATVRPLETVARWVGGYAGVDEDGTGGAPRPVEIVASTAPKAYALEVHCPAVERPDADGPWPAVAAAVRDVVRHERALVFANSRRTVEKLARFVNEHEPAELVWAHHGSLSREVRQVVEERLKNGQLAGLVATNSLELGIDVGSLDRVVLVQAPPSMASAVQRIGRAGHGVGETSRGTLLALAPRDLVDLAVVARAVLEGDIEEVRPVDAPLDVLAQVVASMAATATWRLSEMFRVLRGAAPYRELPRRLFDLVIEMLAGRYAGTRLPALAPVVSVDRIAGPVTGRPGLSMRVYAAGGTIPDRGYFHLRREGTGALLGELDEEFVWERSIGDAFTLGVQTWRVERITHNDVVVTPSPARQALAPFWRADARDRGPVLAARVGAFLEEADRRLGDAAFPAALARDHALTPAAAGALVDVLAAQQDATGGLPHRHRVVVERARDPGGDAAESWTIVHTTWGGRVNRALALALGAALERRGATVRAMHDDGCIALLGVPEMPAQDLLALVAPEETEALVREQLSRTGFFGARFREAAACALLLPRAGFRRRTPLWLSRQRAKELLDKVREARDFPVVLEAWRTCLADELDVNALRALLDEVRDGVIRVHGVVTAEPSPFASNVVWKRTNELMYEDDTPPGAAPVREDLLREAVRDARLRPRVPRALARELRAKLQRTAPGYAPAAADLFDWTVERGVIPEADWSALRAAIERDADPGAAPAAAADPRLALVVLPGGARVVAAVQELPRVAAALDTDPRALPLFVPGGDACDARGHETARALLHDWLAGREDEGALDPESDPAAELLAQWLRFESIVPVAAIAPALGLATTRVAELLAELEDAGRVVRGLLTEDATEAEAADADNLERLLRLGRARARPSFTALPAEQFGPFLAAWQELGDDREGPAGVARALATLSGLPAPAALWETDILPARLPRYQPAWLDAVLAEGAFVWAGSGDETLLFCPHEERGLFVAPGADSGVDLTWLPERGRFTFEELLAASGRPSHELTRALWRAVWDGALAVDGFAAVRRGIDTGFAASETAAPPSRSAAPRAPGRRAAFARWSGSRPFGGVWSRVAPPLAPPADALERDERFRAQARVLLDRYGVVCRATLRRESDALRWPEVFRALRLMELSGEVVTGEFFAGLGTPQFALPEAYARLVSGLDDGVMRWMSGVDPASPLGTPAAPAGLTRVPSTALVFHGTALAAAAEAGGRRLTIHVPPDDLAAVRALAFVGVWLTRLVRPVRGLSIETINGTPAAQSPYREALSVHAFTSADGGALALRRKF